MDAYVFRATILQQDLTSEYDGQLSCSDASESGGACAISNGLSWSGRSLVGALNDLRLRAVQCPILVVSFFNGLGGAFRLYDVLGLPQAEGFRLIFQELATGDPYYLARCY